MASDYPNMDTLYAKLKNIGFDKKFVKRMLPDWWDEECETHPDGILEGVLYISRRLNLELNSLLDDSFIPKIKAPCLPKFKLSTKVNEPNRLLISCSLASRIAELTSFACKNEYQNIANLSVTDIRQAILENNSYISLENTLDFCWNMGIPVVHFAELPKGANKFDGMVAIYDGRPVIIIRKFKDKKLAMKYYNGVVSDLKDFISIKAGFDLFVMNQYNYRQVLRNKSVDEYRFFFAENYLE